MHVIDLNVTIHTCIHIPFFYFDLVIFYKNINLPVKWQTSLWWCIGDFSTYLFQLTPFIQSTTNRQINSPGYFFLFLLDNPYHFGYTSQDIKICCYFSYIGTLKGQFTQKWKLMVTVDGSHWKYHMEKKNYERQMLPSTVPTFFKHTSFVLMWVSSDMTVSKW